MFARLTALLLAISSLLIITPAHAASSSSITTASATTNPIPSYVSPTSPLYTDLLVNNLFHSFSCIAIGQSMIGQPCLTYQVTKNAQGMIQSVPVLSGANLQGGALGAVTGVIAGLYQNPPVRTYDYLASVGQNLGIVKTANAQVGGSGAQVLNPILKLWQVSRNISYILMIIIFLVVGMMIMFRNKINPQTVITAQAALPGLVIGLIMITFSYFFAGLITDTAFISTNIVGYYFISAQPGAKQENLVDKTRAKNVIDIVSSLIKGIKKDDIASGVGSLFTTLGEPTADTSNPATLIRTFAAVVGYQIGSQIGPAIGATVGAVACAVPAIWTGPGALLAIPACAGVGQALGGIGGGLFLAQRIWSNPVGWVGYGLWVIVIIAIVYSMLKLLLKLINNFLTIIFLTITAPFQFLAAALPGRQGIATSWILNMLANVLAFPAVMAVFYFVNYLLGPITTSPLQVTGSTPIIENATLPLLGGLSLSFLNVLLAFAALMAAPAVPDIITRTIGKMGAAGQLIGQELSGSLRSGRGYLGQAQGAIGGVSRDVGNLGVLMDQPSGQYLPDPKNPGKFYWAESKAPGKVTLARRRLRI